MVRHFFRSMSAVCCVIVDISSAPAHTREFDGSGGGGAKFVTIIIAFKLRARRLRSLGRQICIHNSVRESERRA